MGRMMGSFPRNSAFLFSLLLGIVVCIDASDTNNVFQPCLDTLIQKSDGFTFGLAFSPGDSFFSQPDKVQLSPCDGRLGLENSNAQVAVFRPKVDEISLLTINYSNFGQIFQQNVSMVAFAGRQYAARSFPVFVANDSYIVSSFTLVLEFQIGRLQNLYWKSDNCAACSGKSNTVCIEGQNCAIPRTKCKDRQGNIDCSLSVQLTFSGTDKNYVALNSWYEVKNLRQYSLYDLYSNLKNSLASLTG
ncbi:uncharacterized protein LOC116254506 [Nymphaea colorata]|nr:uncharacterized protein LOC116254506 [Nymphaea colorata]